MTRTQLFLAGVVLSAALAAACSGGDESAPANLADETPTVGAPAPGEPIVGAQITRADITASMPTTVDGRIWYPVAGTGDEVLLEATRDVPPVPGEPVPQGRARYDQQFWLWNPVTNERRLAWTNDSDRVESVYDMDGDWALASLYRNNPADRWTIRLHNVQSGEKRDLASVHPDARGVERGERPSIAGGYVVYVHRVPAGGAFVERVELYDILRDSTTTVSETPTDGYQSISSKVSISGHRVAWTEESPTGGAVALHVLDMASGIRTRVAADPGQAWFEVAADGDVLVGGAPGPTATWTTTNRYFAREIAGGPVTTFLHAAVGIHRAQGRHVSWGSAGAPTDLRGYYDIPRNTLHILAPDIPVRGQNSGVVDGWFFWRAPGPEGPQDVEGGTLHVVRV